MNVAMPLLSLHTKLNKILFSPSYKQIINLKLYFQCDRNFTNRFKGTDKSTLHKIINRKFHVNSLYYVKSHQEVENEYAHKVMETRPAYEKSVIRDIRKFETQKLSGIPKELAEFEKVTKQCLVQSLSLENKSLSPLIYDLIKILPKLSGENLIYCLHLLCCWPPTRKTFTPHFKALWNHLDFECVERLQWWNTCHKLLVADYWFQLRLNRITQYNRRMIKDLLQNLHHLTDSEMVQLMFYINLQREVPHEDLRTLETRLLGTIKTISMEELGVICLGFFKTKNKICDISIITAIIERLLKEMENTQQFTIVALMKFLKKSMQISYTEFYIPLLHKSVGLIDEWDIKTCIHSALLASECHVYHPLLLNGIVKKFSGNIEDVLIKDCVKLLQCLSHFNHSPSQDFNELLFSEIKKDSRLKEKSDYPRDLINLALFYAYLGHYDHNLLNIILSKCFTDNCISKFPETKITFAEVDCCIEIECKDYKGHRLDRTFWDLLNNRRGNISFETSKPNTLTRLLREVLSSLQEILDDKDVIKLKHILPHMYSPDIIVQLSGEPASLVSDNQILAPPENEIWACFVIGIPFAFAYRSKHMTGVTAMKLRQLKKLGYKIIFIPFYEIPRDRLLQIKFLKQKLNNVDECTNSNFSLHL